MLQRSRRKQLRPQQTQTRDKRYECEAKIPRTRHAAYKKRGRVKAAAAGHSCGTNSKNSEPALLRRRRPGSNFQGKIELGRRCTRIGRRKSAGLDEGHLERAPCAHEQQRNVRYVPRMQGQGAGAGRSRRWLRRGQARVQIRAWGRGERRTLRLTWTG